MSYGFDIKNKKGDLLVEPGETPLQYWGRKRISFKNNRSSLFDIPDTYACAIYTVVVSGSQAAYVEMQKSGGKWTAKHFKFYGDAVMDVYVFTDSTALPKEGWGVELYDQGRLVFNGTRPILNIKGIANGWVNRSVVDDKHSGVKTESGKVAISPAFLWRKAFQVTASYAIMCDYTLTAYYNGSSTKHGVRRVDVTRVKRAFSYGAASNRNYALIDADYYDKFSSLGNYS